MEINELENKIGKPFNPNSIFTTAPNAIMLNKSLSLEERLIWKALIETIKENGICEINLSKISNQFSIDISTVETAINSLEDKDFIKKICHDKIIFIYHHCLAPAKLQEDQIPHSSVLEHHNLQEAVQTKQISGTIYFLQDDSGRTKIGKTKNLTKRIFNIGILLPKQPILYHSFQSHDITNSERMLHQKYAQYRLNGEWFDLPKEELEHIKENYYQRQNEFTS